ERAIALSTLDLIPCSVASLAQALEDLAAQKLQPPGYAAPLAYATCEAAFRAGEVVPALVDARLARINPGSTSGCVADLRRALGRLPPERREAVVLKHHFWHAERDEGVVVGGGWLTADLCPTTAVATAVVGEIQSWSG